MGGCEGVRVWEVESLVGKGVWEGEGVRVWEVE